MKEFSFFISIAGCLILQNVCTNHIESRISSKNSITSRKFHRKRATPARKENASKRSKYIEELEQSPHVHKGMAGAYDDQVVDNYATENTPVFWKDSYNRNIKEAAKKNEEGASTGGFELGTDDLPSTVGPNENIYGGFPVNDVLGGFELPSPETLAILKAALKKYGPRNEYETQLHHDLENWAYGYEHHALPEYDVKDTPPFYVKMLQGLKMAEEEKKKPSCQQDSGACQPMFHLNDDQCNNLAGNCMPSKPITNSNYEEPCPWKIIEMLFGCKKPAGPKIPSEKPDGIAPPAPKPDEPEKPAGKKPGKSEDETDSKGKPKPIPIEFEEGHATPQHVEKQVQDIKDNSNKDPNTPVSSDARQKTAKLQSQLGLLGMLKSLSSGNQQAKSLMNIGQHGLNTTTKNEDKEHPGGARSSSEPNQKPAVQEDKVEPEFSTWTEWSDCSVTCGNGSLSRTRSCLHWKCDGKVIEIKACNKDTCPGYMEWTSWSPCDVVCGRGLERRKRKCSGVRCSGISNQERSCFKDPCKSEPSSARLLASIGAPWSSWSQCSSNCGFGVQTRKRNCKQGNCALNKDLVQTKICLRQSCSGEIKMSESVQKTCMYIHNSYRISHGAQELKWSDFMADAAEKIAKELATKSATVADARSLEDPGISVMVMPSGDSSDIGLGAACYTAAKSWYAEQKNYDFQNPHLTNDNKHFTQMIWKASHEAGFGVGMSKSTNRFYFVAKYDPPGNQDSYVGFRKNALPLQADNRLDEATVVKRLK